MNKKEWPMGRCFLGEGLDIMIEKGELLTPNLAERDTESVYRLLLSNNANYQAITFVR